MSYFSLQTTTVDGDVYTEVKYSKNLNDLIPEYNQLCVCEEYMVVRILEYLDDVNVVRFVHVFIRYLEEQLIGLDTL